MFSSFEYGFYYYYFLLHIPITVCIDSSVVLPIEWYPKALQQLINWHVASNNDFLLADKPLWLVVFVVVELLVQLPLFVYFSVQLPRLQKAKEEVATGIHGDDKASKVNLHELRTRVTWWLKLYGVNASFTTLVCMLAIFFNGHMVANVQWTMNLEDKLALVGVYLPTFLIPLRLCFV